jgi:TatD DNase family protein
MFDAHCHPTDIDAPELVLSDAKKAGLRGLLCCGYNAASNDSVLALRKKYPRLPFALGLHPWFASEPLEPILQQIRALRPSAVGEAGLDLWGDTPIQPIDVQVAVFEAQLVVAKEMGLVITVHSRKAADAVFAVAKRHPGVRGVLHAFSGSWEQLRGFLDLGWFLGVGGAVTRSRAKRVHLCAKRTPLDRIVVETDAPAIGMDIVEPPLVRPAHLRRVIEAIAVVRGETVECVEQATDANAARLFGEFGDDVFEPASELAV